MKKITARAEAILWMTFGAICLGLWVRSLVHGTEMFESCWRLCATCVIARIVLCEWMEAEARP